MGIEPTTSSLRTRRSPKLSYRPEILNYLFSTSYETSQNISFHKKQNVLNPCFFRDLDYIIILAIVYRFLQSRH